MTTGRHSQCPRCGAWAGVVQIRDGSCRLTEPEERWRFPRIERREHRCDPESVVVIGQPGRMKAEATR